MAQNEITLIAFDIKRWDLDSQRLNIVIYYVLEDEEKDKMFELSITQPPDMVEEFLGKIRLACAQNLKESEQEEIKFTLANETYLQQKLYNYFKKVLTELNNPKRKRGDPKFIYSTHLDVYSENQDISFLPKIIQFFVVLNWARKYYEQENYQKAVGPLRQLIEIKSDFGLAYKWLARSLKKIRKYEDAMSYYQKYAEVDNSLDAWLDLAKSYRKGKIFDKSEKIYFDILEKYPNDKEAKMGLAQIYYARNEPVFLEKLRELHQADPIWLKSWLTNEFNFRIYITPKTQLPPVDASRYLGFEKVFELTQKAFKNEIPSHFNPAKARMSFFKEELDNWSKVVNEFNLLKENIELHPENINLTALKKVTDVEEVVEEEKSANALEGSSKKRSTKVEEIIRKIREAKAQKARFNATLESTVNTGKVGKNEKEKPKTKIRMASKKRNSKKTEVKTKKNKETVNKKSV